MKNLHVRLTTMSVDLYSSPANGSCQNGADVATVVLASAGGAAALVCFLSIVPVVVGKLYRQLVYRLALYQVCSSLAFGLSCVLQLTYFGYSDEVQAYRIVCASVAWFLQLTCYLKLLFSTWMTFHLFLYAVCYKNVKRLEPWFVFGVVLLSLFVSVVPFATHTYGPSGSWCWIQNVAADGNCSPLVTGVVEQFALWYGLALAVLLTQCAAIVVMVTVLWLRLYRTRRYQLLSNKSGTQYYNLLKQLLPLVSYPLIFTVLVLPPFVNRVYEAFRHSGNRGLLLANASIAPAWSLAAGVTLLVHVGVVLYCTRRPESRSSSSETVEREGSITAPATRWSNHWSSRWSTYVDIPSEDK